MEEPTQPSAPMDSKNKAIAAIVVALLLVGIFVAVSNGNKKEAGELSSVLEQSSSTSQNSQENTDQPSSQQNNQPTSTKKMYSDVTELQIKDTQVGTGAEAKTGDKVAVHYRGMLTDGSVFDESYKRGEPIVITLGQGQVIQGWEQGIPGMKVGGKRTLIIPPAMGYGPNGYPPVIPGNATLIFEVELVSVGK
jgi:FK506-binding protein 2